MADVKCVHCGQTRAGLERAPFRNEMGERILAQICQVCWKEWLGRQTALINHYGLDVREKDAREFLTRNMEGFLFATGETDDVDTTRQGTIEW